MRLLSENNNPESQGSTDVFDQINTSDSDISLKNAISDQLSKSFDASTLNLRNFKTSGASQLNTIDNGR